MFMNFRLSKLKSGYLVMLSFWGIKRKNAFFFSIIVFFNQMFNKFFECM